MPDGGPLRVQGKVLFITSIALRAMTFSEAMTAQGGSHT